MLRTACLIGRYPDFMAQKACTSGFINHLINFHASFGCSLCLKIARYSPPTTVALVTGPEGKGAKPQSCPLRRSLYLGRFQGPSNAIANLPEANATSKSFVNERRFNSLNIFCHNSRAFTPASLL